VSDHIRRTAAELADALAAGDVTSVALTEAHLDRIAAVDGDADAGVHAFLHVDREGALAQAAAADERRAAGNPASTLDGVPVAVKDVLATTGLPTTCGSKILEGWVPPYDATVVRRLKDAGLPVLGKTNMDEFAMGSSTEHSAYGPTRNPWDQTRIPGGSGGGSAAAVAAFEAPLAVGTDTRGTIRPPRAVTGCLPAGARPLCPTTPGPRPTPGPTASSWTPRGAPGSTSSAVTRSPPSIRPRSSSRNSPCLMSEPADVGSQSRPTIGSGTSTTPAAFSGGSIPPPDRLRNGLCQADRDRSRTR
jgi:hypothetical protein